MTHQWMPVAALAASSVFAAAAVSAGEHLSAARSATPGRAVAPAKGLKSSEVETVLHTWEQKYTGTSLRVDDDVFLLLKDGTYYKDFPSVPLDEFDVAASRRDKPQNWGRWEKRKGDYRLSSSLTSTRFYDVHRQSTREPARPGERLHGRWQSFSSFSTPYVVSSSTWAITFDRDGRFRHASSGSIVGGVGTPAAGNAVHGATVRDDDSVTSTVGGSHFGGGSSRRRPSSEAERSGSYRLDGYVIELRYDSGRVVRLPFCASADRKAIWFQGGQLDRAKEQ